MLIKCKGYKYEKDNLRGNLTVEIEGFCKVNGIRVMQGQYGLFLAMPSRKIKEEYVPYVTFPKELSKAILDHMEDISSEWSFNYGIESNDGTPVEDDSEDSFPF